MFYDALEFVGGLAAFVAILFCAGATAETVLAPAAALAFSLMVAGVGHYGKLR